MTSGDIVKRVGAIFFAILTVLFFAAGIRGVIHLMREELGTVAYAMFPLGVAAVVTACVPLFAIVHKLWTASDHRLRASEDARKAAEAQKYSSTVRRGRTWDG